jgi:hypothetical protein
MAQEVFRMKTLKDYGTKCDGCPVVTIRELTTDRKKSYHGEVEPPIATGDQGVITGLQDSEKGWIYEVQFGGFKMNTYLCTAEDIRLLRPDELLSRFVDMKAGEYYEGGEMTLIRECCRQMTPLLLWRLLDIAHDNGIGEAVIGIDGRLRTLSGDAAHRHKINTQPES